MSNPSDPMQQLSRLQMFGCVRGAASCNAVHAHRYRRQRRIYLKLAGACFILWQMSVGNSFVPCYLTYARADGRVRNLALSCSSGQASGVESLRIGDKVSGMVESYIQTYGAIIDLGTSGLKGFISNTRMGQKDTKMKKLLKLGQEAEFTVYRVKDKSAHRELTGRSADVELWMGDLAGKLPNEFSVGQLIKGKVTGCSKTAVFVDIGLFADAIAKGAQAAVGDEVTVKVTAVDERLGVEVELQ
eukprot:TRINITY_DN91274_c0_g1_i1.p1 TRINITY_DN91274_c0_g1~~TRINITY_DN91274_c0_g1_i1.p1  ORF type:complete len:244 (+),score=29.71 TRINITY_DN91274_c0_g1_i1:48-779(+)